jgi:hypothetical protein
MELPIQSLDADCLPEMILCFNIASVRNEGAGKKAEISLHGQGDVGTASREVECGNIRHPRGREVPLKELKRALNRLDCHDAAFSTQSRERQRSHTDIRPYVETSIVLRTTGFQQGDRMWLETSVNVGHVTIIALDLVVILSDLNLPLHGEFLVKQS